MFVTVRSFRNYGEMVPAGLIVEPSQIRRFKDKLREGKIVAITETNKQRYNDFISKRLHKAFNVDDAAAYKCPVVIDEKLEEGSVIKEDELDDIEKLERALNELEGAASTSSEPESKTVVATAKVVATAVSKEN